MGLDAAKNLGTLFESRNDGSFVQPTEATPVRDTPPNTLLSYIANDERDANTVRKTAGKAKAFFSTSLQVNLAYEMEKSLSRLITLISAERDCDVDSAAHCRAGMIRRRKES